MSPSALVHLLHCIAFDRPLSHGLIMIINWTINMGQLRCANSLVFKGSSDFRVFLKHWNAKFRCCPLRAECVDRARMRCSDCATERRAALPNNIAVPGPTRIGRREHWAMAELCRVGGTAYTTVIGSHGGTVHYMRLLEASEASGYPST